MVKKRERKGAGCSSDRISAASERIKINSEIAAASAQLTLTHREKSAGAGTKPRTTGNWQLLLKCRQ